MSDDDKKRPQQRQDKLVEKRSSRDDRELSDRPVRHSEDGAKAWTSWDPEGGSNRPKGEPE